MDFEGIIKGLLPYVALSTGIAVAQWLVDTNENADIVLNMIEPASELIGEVVKLAAPMIKKEDINNVTEMIKHAKARTLEFKRTTLDKADIERDVEDSVNIAKEILAKFGVAVDSLSESIVKGIIRSILEKLPMPEKLELETGVPIVDLSEKINDNH